MFDDIHIIYSTWYGTIQGEQMVIDGTIYHDINLILQIQGLTPVVSFEG